MTKRRLEFQFPVERRPEDWPLRFERGEVPGRWPYGLDGLTAFADALLVPIAAPTRMARLRARSGLLHRSVRGDEAIGLTWDENTAHRMTIMRPHREMHTGIVWATDLISRGSSQLPTLHSVLGRMQSLWVNSHAQVAPLREFLSGTGAHVEYFPFGISTEFFPARPMPARPRVVSVGGDRDRDPATLFSALAIVASKRPDVELFVQSGADITPPAGVTKIPRLTHLELRDFYGEASVVAIATRPNSHASGATVSLEAMATGRPVVMTRTPGIDAYVADGETGLLVSPHNPEELARGILRLLADPDWAAAMGITARYRVEASLTTQHLVSNIARLIGLS